MSRSLQELRENAAKGVETCWVIENHSDDWRNVMYLSYDHAGQTWDPAWSRAIKFYDRESCEMVCAEMPDHWDIRIMQHQMMFPLDEEANRG